MHARATRPVRLLTAAALLTIAACAGSPGAPNGGETGPEGSNGETGPPWHAAEDIRIVAETSGGIAGMDWQVTVDGDAREIRLDRCRGCPWVEREPRQLSTSEIHEIARAFVEAGVRKAPKQDFGICEGCADQFFHEIEFTDATGTYRVVGDGPSLPHSLELALNKIIWSEDLTQH